MRAPGSSVHTSGDERARSSESRMIRRRTPKQIQEERKRKRRIFLVRFGVYIALLVGVLGSQTIILSQDLSVAFKPVELGKFVGVAIMAGMLYNKMEGKGELGGKVDNAGRLIRNALYHGFFWMTIIGAWW